MQMPSIRDLLVNAIKKVASNIHEFSSRPGRDFSRKRKLPPEVLLSFLIAQGVSPLRDGLLDFFGPSPDVASVQAFCKQRGKLAPEAVIQTFRTFTSDAYSFLPRDSYQYLAVDGSTFTFTSNPQFSGPEYHTNQGGGDGSYAVHLNAMYDIEAGLYTDGVTQPIRQKDEFRAFCTMVDRHQPPVGSKAVFIGDRGYCSYNNMAHVIHAEQFFLFRCKDVDSKGLLFGLGLSPKEPVDRWVTYTLVRSQAQKVLSDLDGIVRYVSANTSFDYARPNSSDTYALPFRIVRFQLDDNSWECIVTNLPQDEFPPGEIKRIYHARWAIETTFRKLKYTLGTLSFHTYRPQCVLQEIWAGMLAYNLTSLAIWKTSTERAAGKKHEYAINFCAAAHLVRKYLRQSSVLSEGNLLQTLSRFLIPIRPDRKYKRLNTAHFRRPKYILYRPA